MSQFYMVNSILGVNRYYYLCSNDSFAFGGGGGFALYLDGDL